MSTLTNLPASVVPGTPSAIITFSPSSLITEMSIVDAYWSVSSNWNCAVFNYKDNTNHQGSLLRFNLPTNTSVFNVSSTARQNTWTCKTITLYDFDGDSFVINRSSFPTPAEFDIYVSSTPLVYTGSNILTSNLVFHLALDKVNGGTGPFSPGAATAGQSLYDSGPSHVTLAVDTVNAYNTTGSQWAGTGTNGSPYVFNKTARNQLGIQLASQISLSRPLTVGIWYKTNSPSDYQRLMGSQYNAYGWVQGLLTNDHQLAFYSDYIDVTISANPIDGNWHYIVFISDVTNGVKVYIDSVLVGSSSGVTTAYFDYIGGNGHLDANPEQLGTYGAIGQFGDVHAYSSSLSPSDITTNFNQTKAAYGF